MKDIKFNISDAEAKRIIKKLSGPKVPEGWISIEKHLPKWMARDFERGCSEYMVRKADGTLLNACVSDHGTWYYHAKEKGVTHWWNPPVIKFKPKPNK